MRSPVSINSMPIPNPGLSMRKRRFTTFLNVLPENKVAATLRRMDRPADTALTGEVIRQLCQRAGSKAYIAGSIAKLDGEYVLGLKAVNCVSGNLLAKELSTVASKEQVLDALGKEAATIRGRLGESRLRFRSLMFRFHRPPHLRSKL